MVKKDIFSAVPTIVTMPVEVAEPSMGEVILMSGPSRSFRASKSPYVSIIRAKQSKIPRCILSSIGDSDDFVGPL